MDHVIVKEEPDTSFECDENYKETFRKQPTQKHKSEHRLMQTPVYDATSPTNIDRKQIEASRMSNSSSNNTGVATGQVQREPVLGQSTAYSDSAFSLGTRCGEIFVANNAKQWTFVCTFCNKSTRDIGDFICHIKMKHLEESDVFEQEYGNEYYADAVNPDQDACAQDQDVRTNFRHNRRAIEIIPINYHEASPRSSGLFKKLTYSSKQKRVERTSEYLDCGNYLDINVHTEPEELNYNSEKYGNKFNRNNQQNYESKWSTPRPHNQFKQQRLQNNVVQILDDSDNDIEDILETHTSHRGQNKITPRQQQSHQQNLNNASFEATTHNRNGNVKARSKFDVADDDCNEDLLDYTHVENDCDDDDCDEYGDDNGDADDDFDNQLLLPSTDSIESSTQSNDGKIKRRQIRGTAYCALCNKTFQYYSLYRNHMIKHSNETPFKCPMCKKGFKSKQAIRYHMNTHQKEKQFKCAICEAGFYTENQFITHILTHENATTYPCMVCGKVLQSEKERDVHLTTHTEERPFRCEFCQKLFRLRHHLSNHLKMHRQYRCDYCKEEFTSAVHLRKPYACVVCENSPEVREGNINPLQLFDAVVPPTQPTECVDLAEMVSDSDDIGEQDPDPDVDEYEDEDEGMDEPSSSRQTSASNSLYANSSTSKKKPFPCKQCPRAYSHLSGLNYHLRMKH